MNATKVPAKGDRVIVETITGYRLIQNRPFECRPMCKCGECNGVTLEYPGTVTKIIYWMDNSTDAVVMCDDGRERTKHILMPSGDVCY